MLINAIRAENLKSRHSNMWVAVLILPLLTAAIGAIIYGINASANLYDGAVWQQLWLQTGLFYGYFFFPILIAICASYLWRLEHTNHNWNSLMTTPVSRSTIFIAKLVVLAKSILAAQVLLMIFIIIVGKVVFRFEQPLPINMLWWLFMGWFSALAEGVIGFGRFRLRGFVCRLLCCCAYCCGCQNQAEKHGLFEPCFHVAIGHLLISIIQWSTLHFYIDFIDQR